MCLIVFSYRQHPNYDLIFAANRDELYSRPTRPAQFWESPPDLLAGKDLEAGGTWMGVTREGRFSAITNYRDPASHDPDAPTRGKLVLNYLSGEQEPAAYLGQLHSFADQYNGFNLLAGRVGELFYYSNHQGDVKELEPGLYGLSNHLLNTPWPKVVKAKDAFSKALEAESMEDEDLFQLLSDDEPADEASLPDTGVPPKWEQVLSPIFIKSERYGTRCSTILTIDRKGHVHFAERRFKPRTSEVLDTCRFDFKIEDR